VADMTAIQVQGNSGGSWPTWSTIRMVANPALYPVAPPDTSSRKRHLRLWEVTELTTDLVRALARDAEDLSDLRNSHEVMTHSASLPRTLDKRYPVLIS